MSVNSDNKAERIQELQRELEELTQDTVEETETALNEAEETVVEQVEETVNGASEAVETVGEAERQVHQTVTETARETANELGEPQLAEAVADHLFRRLEQRGLLPNTAHHETPVEPPSETPVVETENVVHHTQEAAHADTPPEVQHIWFRPLFGRRR